MSKRGGALLGSIFEIAGAAAVFGGLWLVSPIVGLVVGGLVLFALGLVVASESPLAGVRPGPGCGPERGSPMGRPLRRRRLERGSARPGRIPVGPDQALRLSTVWRCVNLLADLVSGFPIHEYRKSGPCEELPDPPLIVDPSPGTLPSTGGAGSMVSWLLRGNVAGLVGATDPSAIRP